MRLNSQFLYSSWQRDGLDPVIVGGGLKLSLNHLVPLALGSVAKSVCVCVCLSVCVCVCVCGCVCSLGDGSKGANGGNLWSEMSVCVCVCVHDMCVCVCTLCMCVPARTSIF